jgi:bifunctional DNA-binding transcriptional regulator/antitoxin component of YhaV-PrlF toxin-antitoxin module
MLARHQQEMTSLIQGVRTISDQIRTLDRAGYKPGEIARFLHRSYQQVRNVLVSDRRARERKAMSSAEAIAGERVHAASSGSARVRVGPGGEIGLPAALREALGVKAGDVLFARLENEEIHLLTPRAAMKRAQALVRQFVPEGVSLVDELLEDRRREVEQERQDG